ncbi:hypothetical protein HXX76_006955 [Chlamydomonas incerta]|uniref:Uncharacterized protein n=1 Tax=Chlamydomonas incerta TaxID=51695 RepID=A0A835SYX4_CHLIN|nr:hypothetical protein HXX76_006955 [Chlamydomonas incerta]|eukprot:KAG2435759.1 hypothetical protein HXX76_006955 [Chlamydomonas incerta]
MGKSLLTLAVTLVAALACLSVRAQEPSIQALVRSITNGPGSELIASVLVRADKLEPFLPPGYELQNVDVLSGQPLPNGFGLLAINSLRYGAGPGNDIGEATSSFLMIQVKPPAWAAKVEFYSPFQFYMLKAYTGNKAYRNLLLDAGFPIEYRGNVEMTGSFGAPALEVSVPGMLRVAGAGAPAFTLPNVQVVVWYQGSYGTAALFVDNEEGNFNFAGSTAYSPPGSCWADILATSIAGCDPTPTPKAPGWTCAGPTGVTGLVNYYPKTNKLSIYLIQQQQQQQP